MELHYRPSPHINRNSYLLTTPNLTRKDGADFLELAHKIPIKTEIHPYPLEKANEALEDLRLGRFTGTAVIRII